MSATTLGTGAVCPCCHVAVLNAFSLDAWKGMAICCWCADDLRSDDAEHARKLIARTPAEREA